MSHALHTNDEQPKQYSPMVTGRLQLKHCSLNFAGVFRDVTCLPRLRALTATS